VRLVACSEGAYLYRSKEKPDDLATKIGKITAVLLAVGALMAAAKPIYETMAPVACKILPWCGTTVDRQPGLAVGTTGWIYVGTRVDDAWRVTEAEGAEPALTLQTSNIPSPGQVYSVTNSIHLRADLPTLQSDGGRPTMGDSKGEITPGSTVKVDSVKSIDLKIPPRPRTWIWAHVTLLAAPSE
jgi:hypothetical protein